MSPWDSEYPVSQKPSIVWRSQMIHTLLNKFLQWFRHSIHSFLFGCSLCPQFEQQVPYPHTLKIKNNPSPTGALTLGLGGQAHLQEPLVLVAGSKGETCKRHLFRPSAHLAAACPAPREPGWFLAGHTVSGPKLVFFPLHFRIVFSGPKKLNVSILFTAIRQF